MTDQFVIYQIIPKDRDREKGNIWKTLTNIVSGTTLCAIYTAFIPTSKIKQAIKWVRSRDNNKKKIEWQCWRFQITLQSIQSVKPKTIPPPPCRLFRGGTQNNFHFHNEKRSDTYMFLNKRDKFHSSSGVRPIWYYFNHKIVEILHKFDWLFIKYIQRGPNKWLAF